MPVRELNFYTVGKFCAEVNLDMDQPVVDLSEITFFKPFGIVYLGMYLRYFTNRGIEFRVILPDNVSARRYLARQNFWERFNFDEDTIDREKLQRLTTSTSLNDIVDIEKNDDIGDEIGEQLAEVLIAYGSPVPPRKVALVVSELVDNFAQHSERSVAALTLQLYPNLGHLRVAIGDCGIGIRRSLAANPKHSWIADQRHHIAVLEALKTGVSRKREGGVGFTDIMNGLDELGGHLRLATGNEYVLVRRGKAKVGDMKFNLSGVQIELHLPIRR